MFLIFWNLRESFRYIFLISLHNEENIPLKKRGRLQKKAEKRACKKSAKLRSAVSTIRASAVKIVEKMWLGQTHWPAIDVSLKAVADRVKTLY